MRASPVAKIYLSPDLLRANHERRYFVKLIIYTISAIFSPPKRGEWGRGGERGGAGPISTVISSESPWSLQFF